MRTWPSLVGQRFGKLVVLEQAESAPSGQRRWRCRCDCGNETVVYGANLQRGRTTSCGCGHQRDLTGQHIGRLTVLERSDRYAPRGSRKSRLWKCRCDCGAITYKATDTLTNPDISMCRECAGQYAVTRAREKAGFIGGTQLSKIQVGSEVSDNLSGVRGVYLDRRTGKYKARIKFRGKLMELGAYTRLEDAVQARRRGEEEIFGRFLQSVNE